MGWIEYNPTFQQMGSPNIPHGNPAQMLQQFQQSKQQFQGGPQQMVQQLLASGKMPQDMMQKSQDPDVHRAIQEAMRNLEGRM